MKCPGQFKKFGEKFHAYGEQDDGGFSSEKFYGAYGRQEGGSGAEPAGNYQAAHNRRGYGGYGGYGGYEGYEGKEAGGSKGGRARPDRTCHRCKSPGHLVAACPLPPPEKE